MSFLLSAKRRDNVLGDICLSLCLCVCMSVCMFVIRQLSKALTYKVYFRSVGLRGYLPGIRVKFVYEGHRVKFKVTAAEKREIPYYRNVNFSRQ